MSGLKLASAQAEGSSDLRQAIATMLDCVLAVLDASETGDINAMTPEGDAVLVSLAEASDTLDLALKSG